MSRFFIILFLFPALAYTEALLPMSAGSVPTATGFLNDTIPPVITCPPSDTLTLAPGNCDTVYTYVVTAFDSLMALEPYQVQGLVSGDSFPLGTTLNSFLALDSAGNSATCSFSVTVNPAVTMLFCRATLKAYLGVDCWVSPAATEALLPPLGCPAGLNIQADLTAPFGDGPWVPMFFEDKDRDKTYGYRVRDTLSGNLCTGTVQVLDTIAPALDCQTVNVPCALPLAHLSPEFLKDSLGIPQGMPLVTENCPGNSSLTFVDVPVNLPCDSPGTVTGFITRFWTALDASNNVATCVQTINRHRSLDDVRFPADTAASCSGDLLPPATGGPYVEVGGRRYSLLAAPFCEIEASYTDSVAPLCGGSRQIFRTWTVLDACRPTSTDNPVQAVQLVEVADDEGPLFHCPVDTVVQVGVVNCMATLDLPDLIVSDACSYLTDAMVYWTIDGVPDTLTGVLSDFPGNDTTATDTLAAFGMVSGFPVGNTNLFYVATDACGNTGTCEMTLVVWDSLPPVAHCDTFLTAYLDEMGRATLFASSADNGSIDSCGDVYFKIRRLQPANCDTLGNAFSDFLNFCCDDLNDTVPVVLRIYDVPLPAGGISDSLATGQYSECTVPVLVLDINPPQCDAPTDVTVTCALFDSTLMSYGVIDASCRVDSSAVSLNYQQFDTVCHQGTITRTFHVFDASGASGSCTQTITVNNEQHYFVRFPDDLVITMCDTAGNYGAPELFGVTCENMSVSSVDTVVKFVPDACFRIDRTWRVLNWCTYNPNQPLITIPNPSPNALSIHPDNFPGPVVSEPGTTGNWAASVVKIGAADPAPTDYSTFWAAGANGYRYKQTIRVVDIEQPVFENCPAADVTYTDSSDNDYFLWNANYSSSPDNPDQDLCEGEVDLSVVITDACFGADLGVDYILYLDLDDNGTQETVVNSTDLPGAGTIVYDNNNGTGETRFYDLRPVASDDKFQFATRSTVDGRRRTVRLVWDAPGTPSGVILPQLPLGNHRIQWIIYDGCGNENTCEYAFRVEDPDGTCAPTVVSISGTVKTEFGAAVNNVAIQLDGTHPSQPAFSQFELTGPQGSFSFSVPTNSSYTVTPFRNDDYLNGVSTFDLLLINKHVLGIELLNSPYKIIAADANQSKTVTTFDIVELRKLVLGLYQQLPSNTSWRFVDKSFVFPNPGNPFQGGFPEMQTVASLQFNDLPVHDFVGIKVGDVNGNVNPGLVSTEMADRNAPELYLEIPDRAVAAGEVFNLPLRTNEAIAGIQLTLEYPGLELLDLHPGAGMATDNFAVFNPEHSMTLSWDAGGFPEFALQFRAQQAGNLRNMLRLSNRITRTEAYSVDLEIQKPVLRFGGEQVQQPGFALYQNRPNPFSQDTEIGFYLPEAKQVTLQVFDATGRLLSRQSAYFPAGEHAIRLDSDQIRNTTGLLYYQLETDTDRAVGKMLRVF